MQFRTSIAGFVFFCLLGGAILSATVLIAPHFTSSKTIDVPDGTTLNQAASILQADGLIRSAFWFKVSAVLIGKRNSIVAGDYYFKSPEVLGAVVTRLTLGAFDIPLIKITIPEGETNSQVADLLSTKFSLFDKNYFLANAPQGYLFPDTYGFFADVSAKSVIGRMEDVFNTKTADIKSEAENEKRNFANIVVMASILEQEAKTPADMKIVSGILWNRLSIGMALQVDSASTTYENKGLPLVPVSNPGLTALDAALNPTQTDYLYYLSDASGIIHYAKTFAEHEDNRAKYLNK